MYSTRTRVHARIPNGHPREEKRGCRTKVRGQVGELNRPRAPRQADFRARRGTPRRLLCEDPCAEVGEEVCVGVGVRVRVGPVEFKLYGLKTVTYPTTNRRVCLKYITSFMRRTTLPLRQTASN